mmetsp:Transcript_21640/g.38210  ORF Transcript_21640/g.38210 Transcript_21640/m.38210 type:complete len:611 (-) Transcript_21640:44-1876(-)
MVHSASAVVLGAAAAAQWGVAWAAVGRCASDEGDWQGGIVLDESSQFTVQWQAFEQEAVVIELSADFDGWLGFGVAEGGSMPGSDIVTVTVDDEGEAQADDRYVPWAAWPFAPYGGVFEYPPNILVNTSPSPYPELDDSNDWEVLTSWKNESCTNVVLLRKLKTGDPADRDIELDSRVDFVWAFGSGDQVAYHGPRRGVGSLFLSSENVPFEEDFSIEERSGCTEENCTVIDLIASNYTIRPTETTYMCQSFTLPEKAQHIVAIEPLIDNKPYVHHFVLYVCNAPDEYFENHKVPLPCGKTDNEVGTQERVDRDGCRTINFAWASGGEAIVLPPNAGFPVGENRSRYYLLETHYDNPFKHENQVDSSGIRLHLTENLREHDAGILNIGDPFVTFDALPAGQISERSAECSSECTAKMFSEPINVFGSGLHMHAFGKRIRTHLYRGGDLTTEPFVTDQIDNWNFNFQRGNFEKAEFQIYPGDTLFTTCQMDVTKWPEDVKFGLASIEEMCMDFLFYYPLQKGKGSFCGGGFALNAILDYNVIPLPTTTKRRFRDIIKNDITLQNRLAFSVCGEAIEAGTSEEVLRGISIPLQRMDPTWNGKTHFEPNTFAP